MKKKLNFIYVIYFLRTIFQHCSICGFLTFRNSFLCRQCLSEITDLANTNSSSDYLKSMIHNSYCLSLGVYTDFKIKTWIHLLKKGGRSEDYKDIAKLWLRRRSLDVKNPLHFPISIIPSPSRATKTYDHAYCLAQALVEETGWNLRNLLEFEAPETTAQKDKTVRDRTHRTFKLKEKVSISSFSTSDSCKNAHKDPITLNHSSGTIIFVDDVVTTGNTALAAWKALEKPLHFEIWCIAIQPKQARVVKRI